VLLKYTYTSTSEILGTPIERSPHVRNPNIAITRKPYGIIR
jgi:hypothetical protein